MMDLNTPPIEGITQEVESSNTSKLASYHGKGILEALDVICVIEDAAIPCCVVGGHALKYYGVPRAACVSLINF